MSSDCLHSEDWKLQLHGLFCDAFSAEDLHVWICLRFAELRVQLPAPSIGRTQFAFQVLECLSGRGLITAALFEMLVRELPNLRSRIEGIGVLWKGGRGRGDCRLAGAVQFEGPHGVAVTAMMDFTGRVQALADLERALGVSSTVCVVATGIGGVGKTTLVRQFVAVRGMACFPDGVAWLAGGDLLRDLARVSRRFGWGEARDPTAAEAIAWLRQVLSGRRFLLVIDSFDPEGDMAQIPVPGGTCRTVVTSRSLTLSHGLPDTRSLELDLWNSDECVEFLSGISPRLARVPEADLAALAAFVGHLPLGVRLVASFLVNRPSLSAGAALEELQRQPLGVLDKYRGSHAGLAATFQAAWDALDDVGRRVMHALAVCAKETRADIVAAVAGIEEPSKTLDELATRSLVQFTDRSTSPWGLHDVVRMFVGTQPGQAVFVESHIVWVMTHLASYKDPLQHRDFAIGVAEAIQALARLLVSSEYERAYAIYRPVEKYLDCVGQLSKVMALSVMFLRSCPGDSVFALRCMNNLTICHQRLGELEQAIGYSERSLSIIEDLGDTEEKACLLGNLGGCYYELGEMAKAHDCYECSLSMAENLGLVEVQAEQFCNLGCWYIVAGEIKKGIEHLEHGLDFFTELNLLYGQGKCLGNLGACNRRLGDVRKGIDCHERALDIFVQLGRLEEQAQQLANLAACYASCGHVVKARDNFRRALELYREVGLPDSHESVRKLLAGIAALA